MDKNTYGNNQAAMNLADMINQHPNKKVISRKVGRTIDAYFGHCNEVEVAINKKTAERILKILRDEAMNSLKFLNEGDPLEFKIKTHAFNVIKTRYTSWVRGERDHITRFEEVGDLLIIRRVDGHVSIGHNVLHGD